jgi:hypothetical protein
VKGKEGKSSGAVAAAADAKRRKDERRGWIEGFGRGRSRTEEGRGVRPCASSEGVESGGWLSWIPRGNWRGCSQRIAVVGSSKSDGVSEGFLRSIWEEEGYEN